MKRSLSRPAAALALAVLGAGLRYAPAADDSGPANTLTADEAKAGWKLLFDGHSLAGWHNFKREGVRAGWQAKDGTLACVDPRNAGDIVTADEFAWFELSIEYTISKGGNSGIMFHVTDAGRTAWATGPEVQLQDNADAHDPQLSGWLYQLYKSADDPKTGRPIDATRPAGEWNRVRVVIAPPPGRSSVTMNGVTYFEFVFGSAEFKDRIARSKFRSMPDFAKSGRGHLALQGDHGAVAFRNVKVRPIPASAADGQ